MQFGTGNKLTQQGADSIVTEQSLLSDFTASNVNTTGSPNTNTFPTIVIDNNGNVVIAPL